MNYYNEFDPYAAQWLRNLIDAGHIPQGEVDTRSIKDVSASDLTGFVQCHFFAGLGGWSHALRLAGWPDDRPVWTGSCPCQPFSAAGTQKGTADDRHLWPVWFNLIRECRPGVVFGEQVEAAINHGWLDLVQSDLESEGYACGAAGIPAAGVGAPHIRQRLWFVADTQSVGRSVQHTPHDGSANAPSNTFANANDSVADQRRPYVSQLADANIGESGTGRGDVSEVCSIQEAQRQPEHGAAVLGRSGASGRLGNNNNKGLEGQRGGHCAEVGQREGAVRPAAASGESGGVADTERQQKHQEQQRPAEDERERSADCTGGRSLVGEERPGPTNGHWRNADWLHCRDGKWRPVEPGTFPLAHGAAARVGRLRAYGNAIVPQVAQVFIEAYLES
jgi:DNA (cytosine-5)-methyltransferase 1